MTKTKLKVRVPLRVRPGDILVVYTSNFKSATHQLKNILEQPDEPRFLFLDENDRLEVLSIEKTPHPKGGKE